MITYLIFLLILSHYKLRLLCSANLTLLDCHLVYISTGWTCPGGCFVEHIVLTGQLLILVLDLRQARLDLIDHFREVGLHRTPQVVYILFVSEESFP